MDETLETRELIHEACSKLLDAAEKAKNGDHYTARSITDLAIKLLALCEEMLEPED